MSRFIIFILTLLVTFNAALADDISWSGTGGDNRWDNPNNWSGGQVPGANDNAFIYSPDKPCNLPDGSITVNGLYINEGTTVNAGNSQINAYHFDNSGKIDVTGNLQVNPKDEQGLNFDNFGEINAGNASLSFGTANQNGNFNLIDVSNSGTINGNEVNIQGTQFTNYGATSGDKIFINVTGTVTNVNMAHLEGNYNEESPGGSVWIFAEDFVNDRMGTIRGGNSQDSQGGSVNIWCAGTFTNQNYMASGSGTENSYVNVVAGEILQRGGINSHYGSMLANAQKKAVYGPGNVYLLADSVDIGGEHSGIWASSLFVRGRIVIVHDLLYLSTIEADTVNFNSTADGKVDFSGLHTSQSITSRNGINIFSDNIIAPAEGLNVICGSDPIINPADTSIIDASITSINVSGIAGVSKSFRINLQNLGTGSKVLKYEVSSIRGWVLSLSDSTALLPPFDFADFSVNYTIPGGTVAGTTDTVKTILKIGTSFADTAFCTITCIEAPQQPSLTIVTNALKDGQAGVFYTDTLKAEGGLPPHQWSAIDHLPTDFSLDSSTGIISGTPVSAEVDTFTVIVSDSQSPPDSVSIELTINILPGAISRIDVSPVEADLNFGDQQQFTASGVDAFENETSFSPVWFATGGTINEAGLFSANEVGDFIVTATDTGTSISGTASVTIISTGVKEHDQKPTELALFQNYPNPFNPETTIRFDVKERTPVVLKIYDILGREVKVLVNSVHQPGSYRIIFDAKNFASGVYFYRIQMKDFVAVKKMVLLE